MDISNYFINFALDSENILREFKNKLKTTMTAINNLIKEKHLEALKPSRFSQTVNEADSCAMKITDLLKNDLTKASVKGGYPILSMQLCSLQSEYCFFLLDLLNDFVVATQQNEMSFILYNLYDVNKKFGASHDAVYFSADFIHLSSEDAAQELMKTPCYKETEEVVIREIKDIVTGNPNLHCFFDNTFGENSEQSLLKCNDMHSMLQMIKSICEKLVYEASRRLLDFKEEDVISCYNVWNSRNSNDWLCLSCNDFIAWEHGLFTKHKENNIRAKYNEYLTKLYESGFLDFIIEKMDIRYEKDTRYEKDNHCRMESFLSIDDDVYVEKNGLFYPENDHDYHVYDDYDDHHAHHVHARGQSAELLLAEHAVGELLFDDGTPNPESVGKYLMLKVAELGENEIRSFFEFINFKEKLEQLAEQNGILHIGFLSCMTESSEHGSSFTAQSYSGNQSFSESRSSCTGGRASKTSCWHPEKQIHRNLCRKLSEKGYCHVDGDHYQWTATIEEFGYLIYYSTKILKIGKHPSSDRILWDMFCPFFGINDKKKKQAQNAITSLKRDLEAKKHNANCEKAENIKRLIMMVKV